MYISEKIWEGTNKFYISILLNKFLTKAKGQTLKRVKQENTRNFCPWLLYGRESSRFL